MMDYQDQKERARDKALEIRRWLDNNNPNWGELAEIQNYLGRLGKRYGLLKEFRENRLL